MIFYLSFSFVGTTESVRLTPQMKDFIAYRTSGKWKQLARVLSSDNDIDIIIEQIEHDCRKSMYDQSYKMIAKLIERRSHVEWEFFKNGLMIIKADGIVDDFEKQFITNNRGIYFFSQLRHLLSLQNYHRVKCKMVLRFERRIKRPDNLDLIHINGHELIERIFILILVYFRIYTL